MLRLFVCLLALLPGLLFAVAPPSPRSEPKSFRLDRRLKYDASRVTGWPDPPPPYRTRRVFERHSFRSPVYLISHPLHDLVFVIEQNGRIVSLPPDGKKAPTEFLKLSDADAYSLSFHPEYKKNKLVYVFSNGPNSKKKKQNQILRYRVEGEPPRCDPKSKQLVIEWESNGHNGGDMAFGRDGMLYITSGDGTSDSDTDDTGQDLRDLCSGVLRIDVDRPAKGKNYAIPTDNPFLKTPGARGELWAFGFRNPWRMTIHPENGDLLIGDVGQDLWEMIRLVRKGSNHGWSVTEGSSPFHPLRKKGPGEIVKPLIEHPHSESRSITGGVVYQGKKYPELRGVYVYADYSTGKVWGLKYKGDTVTWKKDLAQTRLATVGIGADRDGELYLVDYGGQIHMLEPNTARASTTFPRKLSESGLFASVKGHQLHPALIPYDVNSPLWSDGTHKERAIALPGLEGIGFAEKGAWKFPEQTTLVKTFSLDLADGSRKRVETRLLTMQQGEWFGYSYAWNDEQTDATLVAAPGMDRTYRVRDGKKRDLTWHYPSRVECMVCHTRAANYVLGLSTAQMNRTFEYPTGEKRNQLAALAGLGLFRFTKMDHFKVLEQRGRVLRDAVSSIPLGPLQKCCIEPARKVMEKKLDARHQAMRRDVQKANSETTLLPRDPDEYQRLADPIDVRATLEARVRSYLHANCAICHVEAGGGNSAINLHIDTALDKMKLINERPLHDRFGIADAMLVAAGAPEKSILYQRLTRRGKGQMPPLASHCVDVQAVAMIEKWIREMRKEE